jgi:hypothetical protein
VVTIPTVAVMIKTVIVITNTMIVITVTTIKTTNITNREGLQIKSKPFPVAQTRILVMFGGWGDNPAAGMQAEVLEILLDSHITDQKKFTQIPFSEGWRRRQQNEKVTFWNNPFSVGKCLSYHDDGSGRYKYWNFSTTTHRI